VQNHNYFCQLCTKEVFVLEQSKKLNKVFADNLNYYLELNNMMQKELATYLGCSNSVISDWCCGIKMPRPEKLDKICKLFGIELSDLINERGIQSNQEKIIIAKYLSNNDDIHRIIASCKKMSKESLKSLADFLESK
jgi:transcriptional regulator with XRE-family HTH domain